ncbi:hypothetical protein LEP3755_21910 [Leptolyngbya sp. NIES-3755]|nr:hypothetical protein LEP3755_21910 [Leptolyngbya sp. NIES-3755]
MSLSNDSLKQEIVQTLKLAYVDRLGVVPRSRLALQLVFSAVAKQLEVQFDQIAQVLSSRHNFRFL